MRKSYLVWLLGLLQIGCCFRLNGKETDKQERILIILDASMSMQQSWQENTSRYKAASDIIMQLMDSVYACNNETEFGLRVYGHRSPAQVNDCYDTKLEVMYSRDNYTQMGLRLASLRTRGITPVVFALKEAITYDMLDVNRYNYHLILITDGGESCGGKTCELSQQFTSHHLPAPCIVSLTNDAVMREAYSCLGAYYTVSNQKDIGFMIHTLLSQCAVIPCLGKPKPRLSEGIADKAIAEKVSELPKPKDLPAQEPLSNISITTSPIPTAPVQPVAAKPAIVPEPDAGFGYMKIKDLTSIKRIKLYYEGDTGYTLIDKMNLSTLSAGIRVQLKAGKYMIVYDMQLQNQLTREASKTFTVIKNMITDVELK